MEVFNLSVDLADEPTPGYYALKDEAIRRGDTVWRRDYFSPNEGKKRVHLIIGGILKGYIEVSTQDLSVGPAGNNTAAYVFAGEGVMAIDPTSFEADIYGDLQSVRPALAARALLQYCREHAIDS